jgi:hypothetical protein
MFGMAVTGFYGKSMISVEATGCYESKWFLWKSLIAK